MSEAQSTVASSTQASVVHSKAARRQLTASTSATMGASTRHSVHTAEAAQKQCEGRQPVASSVGS